MIITKVVEQMLGTFGQDARRINHALKVYGFAAAIAELTKVGMFEQEVIELSAILHDIGIQEAERNYFSAAGKYQEVEGPPIAKRILEECGYNEDTINRVLYIIGHHHTYSKIDGIDFQILVEADFLVNIHEDSIGKEAAASIRNRYFKTVSGIKLINMMYLTKP